MKPQSKVFTYMKLTIGEVYRVDDVTEGSPCQGCNPCIKLRLMELGFICGETVRVKKHQLGIYILSVLSYSGHECSTIALRDDETSRIKFEKI